MNANAKKWVAALKSGKYKQTTGALKKKGGYCCLGVACELYRKEHKDEAWRKNSFMGHDMALPEAVRDWLGLNSNTGTNGADDKLTVLNDDRRWKFSSIAKFIEKEPDGLFKRD